MPHNIVLFIAGICFPSRSAWADGIYWSWSSSGEFLVQFAYQYLKHSLEIPDSLAYKYIWKWPGPHRIHLFLWLAFRRRLLTNLERTQDICIVIQDIQFVILLKNLLFAFYVSVWWPTVFGINWFLLAKGMSSMKLIQRNGC